MHRDQITTRPAGRRRIEIGQTKEFSVTRRVDGKPKIEVPLEAFGAVIGEKLLVTVGRDVITIEKKQHKETEPPAPTAGVPIIEEHTKALILRALAGGGWVPHNDVTRSAWRIDRRVREAVIASAIKAGEIAVERAPTRGRTVTRYRLTVHG